MRCGGSGCGVLGWSTELPAPPGSPLLLLPDDLLLHPALLEAGESQPRQSEPAAPGHPSVRARLAARCSWAATGCCDSSGTAPRRSCQRSGRNCPARRRSRCAQQLASEG